MEQEGKMCQLISKKDNKGGKKIDKIERTNKEYKIKRAEMHLNTFFKCNSITVTKKK